MNNEAAVGYIIARFQVAELTQGHKEILDYVLSKNHNQNVIVLGVSPLKCSKNNPLDFDARQRMIEEAYPSKFLITYINDNRSDEVWSSKLDEIVTLISGNRDSILYGSRDSFKEHYHGKFPVDVYQQKVICSGTEQRELCGHLVKSSKDWRSGVIYGTQNKYPTVYPTVDIAIVERDCTGAFKYIYLAKKATDTLLRFVGGFVDPSDNCFEEAALREAKEETNLDLCMGTTYYLGNFKVDDWRYKGEEDAIITSFYVSEAQEGGNPKALDDIAELHRAEIEQITEDMIVEGHRPLWRRFKEWLDN